MRAPPNWYPEAARRLAAGETQVVVSSAVGCTPKTLRRHLDAPSGVLKALVEKARAVAAAAGDDELAPLRAKMNEQIKKAVDAGDISVIRALIPKMFATPEPTPPPDSGAAEPEITEVQAVEELIAALPAVADLARARVLAPDLMERLRSACGVFLADDLQPRAPIDVEAERVEVAAPETPDQQPPDNSAAIIPIRN